MSIKALKSKTAQDLTNLNDSYVVVNTQKNSGGRNDYVEFKVRLSDLQSAVASAPAGPLLSTSGIWSSAQISTLNSGLDIVSAQGANTIIAPYFVLLQLEYNTIAYTVSNNVGFRWGTGTVYESTNTFLKSSSDITYCVQDFLAGTDPDQSHENLAFQFVDDAVPATGNSSIKYYCEYSVVDLSLII